MNLAYGLLRGLRGAPAETVERASRAARDQGCAAQLVAVGAVESERQLRSAALHAERALREGRARTGSLELEFLCYLTGERQIRRALEAGGLQPGATEAWAVILGEHASIALPEVARALSAELAQAPLRAGPTELAALERVALLDVER